MPEQPEIIINLWYVHDDMGFIYSLRARLYIAAGSDEEKLAYLQRQAGIDYLIARAFPIPKRYQVNQIGCCHKTALDALNSPLEIFQEAIKILRDELPGQTPQDVPPKPLFCLTSLFGDDSFHIEPRFEGQIRHR